MSASSAKRRRERRRDPEAWAAAKAAEALAADPFDFDLSRTETGRLSSSSPNVQNLPSTGVFDQAMADSFLEQIQAPSVLMGAMVVRPVEGSGRWGRAPGFTPKHTRKKKR